MPLPKDYIRVSKRRPCPICGKPDWCLIARDGTNAVCTRTISSKPFGKGDAGYIHKIADPIVVPQPIRKPPPSKSYIAWNSDALRHEQYLSPDQMTFCSNELRVTQHSLWRLCMGWSSAARAYTFPMSDGKECIGIRLRRPDGPKFAVTGSSNGLFIPRNLTGEGPLLIVEGPTDTAAMLDLGFDCIGRPSCSSCVDMTVAYCEGRDVVIVEDHDEQKVRPDGTVFYPGQEGAEALANAMVGRAKSVKIIAPPAGIKDSRAWKIAGATDGVVRATIQATAYFGRKCA